MTRNSFLIIAAMLFASLFLFGCTGSYLSQNASEKSGMEIALAQARADSTQYVLRLSVGEDKTPFSGTMHFLSDSGKKSFNVPGYLLIDKSDVCSGGDGKTEKYDEVLVTFDDSPVGETWSWGAQKYCEDTNFWASIEEAQMQKIKSPMDAEYTKATSALALERGKIMIYIRDDDDRFVSGNGTFVSSSGNRTVRFEKYAVISASDFCDGDRSKYSELYFAFDISPMGETRHWAELDYCRDSSYGMHIDTADLDSMRDPRFDISLFEHKNFGGNPINATVYCNNRSLGTLVDGHLNISKSKVLQVMGATNCSLDFIGNFTVFERPYRFNFCGWTLDKDWVMMYSAYNPNLGKPFDEYLRRAPCDTSMSFITPDDPTVKYRLLRYMQVKTTDTYMDLDNIIHYMAKDFGYEKDTVLFNVDDWMQLPTEFMSVKYANKGDCEDWAVTFLSLVYAREPTRCWAMRVGFMYANDTEEEGHVSVFCDVNGVHKIYDQVGTIMEPDLWSNYFIWFDGDHAFRDKGVVRIKPFSVFNNTFYSPVDDVAGMYRVLGIKS